MNQGTIKTALKLIMAVVITFGLSLAMQSILAQQAWTNPQCAPPGCNVARPINVGSSTAAASLTQPIWSKLDIGASSTQITTVGMGVAGDFIVNVNDFYVRILDHRVGIGTADPGQKLSIGGGHVLLDNNFAYRIKDSGGTQINALTIDAANDLTLVAGANGDIQFAPNAGNQSVQMIVKATTGRVGIGTVNPQHQLEIAMPTAGLLSAAITNTDTGGTSFAEFDIANGASTFNDALRLTTLGQGWNDYYAFKRDGAIIFTDVNLLGGLSIMTRANVPIRFYTNGEANERMRISADGKVGIGTEIPGEKLSVNGNIENFGGSDGFKIKVLNGWSGGWANRGLTFRRESDNAILGMFGGYGVGDPMTLTYLYVGTDYTTPWATFLPNGNVGVGTTIPGAKLDVNGTLKITDGTQGAGKVLMSDATGLASWVATSSLGISGGSGPSYNINMGEDFYEYWNTDGGGWGAHAPHADNCNGNNTNPYVCLPNEEKTCLDSAETTQPAHHRTVICRRATISSNPGTHQMTYEAIKNWDYYTDILIDGIASNGSCTEGQNCAPLSGGLGMALFNFNVNYLGGLY